MLSPRDGEPIDALFVTTGRLDDLSLVLSDGSSPGTMLVPCDGHPVGDGLRCDTIDGRAVVVGEDIALAWVPPSSDVPVTDVLVGGVGTQGAPASLQPGRDLSMLAATVPCVPLTCTLPSGCPGRRLCTDGTVIGACVPYTSDQTCNGIDDDCDGNTDENATAASCNDGIACTVDSCNTTIHACVNQPFGLLCTPNLSDCTVGICTNNSGISNAERSFSASDSLVAPTGVAPEAGCTYRAGHSWCTNTWDSCNCNGPEVCAVRARLGSGNPIGCTSAPFAAPGTPPTIYAPCDVDNIACTAEAVCCEPAGAGYCRIDTLLNQANPTLLQDRQRACALGGTDSWSAVPGFPVGVGSVLCSPPNPRGAPYTNRCQNDGNPCTTITCSESLGGVCTTTSPALGAASETYINSSGTLAISAACSGEIAGTRGCTRYQCGGTPTCQAVALADGSRTSSCDIAVPPPGVSLDNPGDCAIPRCRAGSCAPSYYAPVDGTTCPTFPASCGSDLEVCSFSVPSSPEFPDIPDGCRPPLGYCYLSYLRDPDNGTLDGRCVANGRSEGNPCLYCNDSVNPFDLTRRPEGYPCTDDDDPCTSDVCAPTGRCNHSCNFSLPGCASCVPD